MRYTVPLLFAVLAPLALAAQNAPAPAPASMGADAHASAPVLAAARAAAPIRVDGRLDEEAWAAATPVTGFMQLDPAEGKPVTEPTEIRVLYDDEALYVGARLRDSAPVTTRLGRRDMSMEASDWLTVILDSYHDHRTAYGFEINPSGVRRDQTRSESREDDSWDPVWEGQTSIDSTGWTAELRIPFSQLRFNPAREQTWGIQVERQIARKGEFAVFSFTPRSQPGGIPRFGHLTGLSSLRTGKRVEVLPYSVMKAEHVNRGGNPFRSDREYTPTLGVDLKYRVTSDLTLDATVNPDFGQVEVDPAEVNLSAIETRFQEKRPFFVEGSEIFNFGSGGGNSVFYSRRIGRAPQLSVPSSIRQRADVPEVTNILGAAKLSGRTGGGWSVGVLNAVTRREEALYLQDSARATLPVEPLSNYFVGRLRRDFRRGQTVVGGMLTSVHRDLDSDPLRHSLHDGAYTGGVDFRHEWAQRTWALTGFLSGSYVAGDRQALLATQLAPWRYFQRPDQDEVRLDSTRTSLTGIASELQLSLRRGRNWRPSLTVGTITPGYEVNDLGFQYRANRMDVTGNVQYVENRPGAVFRNWSVFSLARGEWNYDGDQIINSFFLGAFGRLLNYWNGNMNVGFSLPSWDDRLTRGGPITRRPANARVFARVASDNRKRVAGESGSFYQRDDAGGWSWNFYGDLLLKPAPSWNLSIGPSLSRSHSGAQYLGARRDPLATSTYRTRYLFAELDQTTVALETRLNVTFTPDLSLQVYAQPFLSSADFGDPAELAAPRTYDFRVYGRDLGAREPAPGGYFVSPEGKGEGKPRFFVADRDFNLRSLRGNAVLRWEWRPGSTLYLAWQQNRSDFAVRVGDFDLRRDRRALFAAQPDNVFVLKVSYWLNP
jgi:hypothetical protein